MGAAEFNCKIILFISHQPLTRLRHTFLCVFALLSVPVEVSVGCSRVGRALRECQQELLRRCVRQWVRLPYLHCQSLSPACLPEANSEIYCGILLNCDVLSLNASPAVF